jgi:hypothetical protein
MNNDDRIRGYVAADILIEEMLNDARQKLEPYAKWEGENKEWWDGYFQGLVVAHSYMTLGKSPDQPDNKKR